MSRSTLRAGERGLSASQRALELAYRYVATRERTTCEVRGYLLGRDLEDASVTAAIEELAGEGLLDDARFASLFVEDKRTLEQWGNGRIRRALLVRGVDPDLIDAALAPADDDGQEGSELDRALAVLRARFPAPPQDRRERERALGMLLRKGYEPELALEALQAHGRAA